MEIRILFGVTLSLLSFLILTFFIFGQNGIVDTYKKQEKIDYLRQEIEKVQKQNEEKKEIIKNLRDARLKEVYIKGVGFNLNKGEYVFKFNDKESPKIQINKLSNTKIQDKTILLISIFVILAAITQILLMLSIIRTK